MRLEWVQLLLLLFVVSTLYFNPKLFSPALEHGGSDLFYPVHNSSVLFCRWNGDLVITTMDASRGNTEVLQRIGCAKYNSTTKQCQLCLPSEVNQPIKEVIIEIGTNVRPEYGAHVKANQSIFFIAVEPIPSLHRSMVTWMTTGENAITSDRFLALPAVVAPGDGYDVLHE
eukprot:PhF_6_TR42757/c0_g2_i4/m.64663